MYASNVFSKRRPSGWVERRRRYARLTERVQVRDKAGKPEKSAQETSDRPKS